MKKTFMRAKEYWLNLMRSTRNKISQGAAGLFRSMPHARGENWRHKDEKK